LLPVQDPLRACLCLQVCLLSFFLSFFLSFEVCHCKEAEGGAERSGRKIDVDVVPCMGNRGGAPPFASRK
jgi:hypothetical protein